MTLPSSLDVTEFEWPCAAPSPEADSKRAIDKFFTERVAHEAALEVCSVIAAPRLSGASSH